MKNTKLSLIVIIGVELFIIFAVAYTIISEKDTLLLSILKKNVDYPKNTNTCMVPSRNLRRIIELQPNCSTYFDGFAVGIPLTVIHINSDGFRDKEYSIEKPNNTFRIIVLGDSFTFGWGVNISDAYTEVLERKLGSLNNSIHYEVLKFGVPGYNTQQEVEFLRTSGLKYSPDMIIVQYYYNDISNKTILENITKDYEKGGFNTTSIEVKIKIIEDLKKFYKEGEKERFENLWYTVKNPLRELYDITIKNNISVILIDFDLVKNEKHVSALKELCKEYNWSLIILGEYNLVPDQITLQDLHFNKLGHDITARILFECLTEKEGYSRGYINEGKVIT